MMRRLLLLALVAACGSPQPHGSAPAPVVAPSAPVAATASAGPQTAPKVDDLAPSPLDPQIRRGVLPNGLTYYVMPHHKPEKRAVLWLAVDAGSVLEDNDQRGLAHFVEHMAFNGTKRFAKSAIVDYIEKVGMQFGPDVNAYTSFDETVYQLTVPSDDKTAMATGLDILRDWAGDVAFDPVEVDKERGVVLEEWRLGRGAFARIEDKQWPVMFQGSRYAERLPIGLPEVIKAAPRDTLVRFYKDWYRPELMAVIAVGDFDADVMQKEIAAKFGDLKSAGKRARDPVPVPHEHPTAVTVNTDPEMPYTLVQVYDKLDHRPEVNRADYRRTIVEGLYHRMLNARLAELALDPKAPFLDASSSTSDLTRSADGFVRGATAKQGRAGEALAVLVREIERVERHGFLQTELDRARKEALATAETDAAEWDKTPSDAIADEMTRHFLQHEQMPGRPVELQYYRDLLPTATLAELNHLAKTWGGDKGRVITLSGPSATPLPGEPEVKKLVAAAGASPVDAWIDTPPRPLLVKPPARGTIAKRTELAGIGATLFELGNGIRVVVKPTTYQNDQVEIQGFQPGGSSLIEDVAEARFADDIVARGGAGELDPIALRKALAGKVAEVNVYFSELSEGVYGSARPADLETALHLLYLKMTAPRRDERAFAAWKAEQIEYARNRRLQPEQSFYEDMTAIRYGNHPRYQPTSVELVDKADLDKAMTTWRARMADLSNFTFIIVGNVDATKVAPLLEAYVASLPGRGRKEVWKDVGVKYPSGKIEKTIVAGTEPKSYVSIAFGAPDTWSRDGERDARILAAVLRIRLREVLREDLGGVYGTRVFGSISRQPTQRRDFTISFGCDPDNVKKLRAAALDVIHAVQKSGISDDYIAKVREQLKRERETDAKENWWWGSQLRQALWFDDPIEDLLALEPTLARITSANIQAAAKRFLDETHVVVGVLKPTAAAKKMSVDGPPRRAK